MKKIPVILALLTACLFSFSYTHAQTSISGDSLCGATAETACNFSHLQSLVKGVMFFIIGLGLPLLIVIIAYRFIMAWFAAAQGQTGAYKDATKKAGQSILGFMILVALFGGVLTVILKYLGATEPVIKLLELIASSIGQTAHAQDVPLLPSPIEDTNLYDFILKILAMVMRFFVYPALIVIWVATGFSFVLAQGKPEALSKAKKLVIWATVSTFIVVMIQAFLFAAKGTVEQILPGATTSQTTTQITQTNGQAANREANAVNCQSSGGVLGSDGVSCETVASRAGSAATDYCSGKTQGTLCSIPISTGVQVGVCKKDTVVSCFKANDGDYCLTTLDQAGKMTSGSCVFSQSIQQEIAQELVKEELILPQDSDGFVYSINGNTLTLVKKPQYVTETKERHDSVWQLFKKVNPDSVSSAIKDIKIYYVKDGPAFACGTSTCSGNDIAAEIVAKGYPKGYFGLEVNLYHYLLEDGSLDEEALAMIMIHEGGHVLSFAIDQVSTEHTSIQSVLKECSTFARQGWKEKVYICLKKEAYLSKFTELFYTTPDHVRFYPKVAADEAFVSDYAKTRAHEDFAEVYKAFITTDARPLSSNNEAEKKILYMYGDQGLVSIRAKVRGNLGV